MIFTPRDYQQQAVDDTLNGFEQHQCLLGVMATGMGKTAVSAWIANHFKDRGRILFLVHQDKLLSQGQKTLEKITGCRSQIEKADVWADRRTFGPQILFATIQTMIAGRDGGRMTRFEPKDFSFVVVDEGHHSVAPSWRKVIDHFRQNPDLRILLMTATPDRGDEKALGQIAEDVAFEYDINYGIDNGWLVLPEQIPCHVHSLDLSAMHVTAGELNGGELAANLEEDKTILEMATPVLDACRDEKTLIFTATVEQARKFAAVLNGHKPGSAEYVCGKTPAEYRGPLYDRYANGKFQYLINVGIAVEGFDEPAVRWIVMGRPHLSRAAYAQKVGRGTRPLPGIVDGLATPEERIRAILASAKPKVSVLDFCGNAGKHKLVHVADVLGGKYPDEVIELANRNIEREGKPADIPSELVRAEREIDRRRKEAAEADRRAKVYTKIRSIYSFGKSIDPFDALDIVPCREPAYRKGRRATDGQRAALEKFGVNAPDNMSFVHASQVLDALVKRVKSGLPSLKQERQLRKRGLFRADMTYAEARTIMDKIAAKEGWRRTG
ncbi:MAG: DEAD/DEAH box helicase [Candidatus Hydrogenedentales bacterium]|jgi:superfamily II DNA or RNA helicase